MEQNNAKFRLRLNLFDAVVLLAALAVGAAVVWFGLRPGGSAASSTSQTVRYTVLFQGAVEGTSALIQPGDALEDTVKNYQLGSVVSVEVQPALVQVLDQESRTYVDAVMEGYEDVYITVESACTGTDEALLLDGGYDVRVGQTAYVRGPGYMGSGPVTAIAREG